jgi:hypothetical protein
VREHPSGEVDSLASVARLTGDEHAVLGVDQRGGSDADRGSIIGDEHADHRLRS